MRSTAASDSTDSTAGSFLGAPRTVVILLLLLLVVDAVLIGFDLVVGASDGYPDLLHVYREGGIPEWFQWLKFLAAAILVLILARRTVGLYWVWAGIFLYLFADDAFMGHERVAGHVVRILRLEEITNLPFEVWIVVEPAYMALVAGVVLVALWYVSRGASSPSAKRYTLEALVLLALLVGFAGVGDVIGKLVFGGTHAAEVIEDGGEMIAASLLLAHAARQVAIELGHLARVVRQPRPERDTGPVGGA